MLNKYEKAQKTLLEKRFKGDVEALREYNRQRSSKGGRNSTNRPFSDKELAKKASAKGVEARCRKRAS